MRKQRLLNHISFVIVLVTFLTFFSQNISAKTNEYEKTLSDIKRMWVTQGLTGESWKLYVENNKVMMGNSIGMVLSPSKKSEWLYWPMANEYVDTSWMDVNRSDEKSSIKYTFKEGAEPVNSFYIKEIGGIKWVVIHSEPTDSEIQLFISYYEFLPYENIENDMIRVVSTPVKSESINIIDSNTSSNIQRDWDISKVKVITRSNTAANEHKLKYNDISIGGEANIHGTENIKYIDMVYEFPKEYLEEAIKFSAENPRTPRSMYTGDNNNSAPAEQVQSTKKTSPTADWVRFIHNSTLFIIFLAIPFILMKAVPIRSFGKFGLVIRIILAAVEAALGALFLIYGPYRPLDTILGLVVIAGAFISVLMGKMALNSRIQHRNQKARPQAVNNDSSDWGKEAEENVAYALKWLPKGKYDVFRNRRLNNNGMVQEFDSIVIGANGVFNIEIKDYAGKIMIDEYGNWTREKNDHVEGLQNPLSQVQRHRKVLTGILGEDYPIIDVVVLANEKSIIEGIKNSPLNIVRTDSIQYFIENYRSEVTLSHEDREKVKNIIISCTVNESRIPKEE